MLKPVLFYTPEKFVTPMSGGSIVLEKETAIVSTVWHWRCHLRENCQRYSHYYDWIYSVNISVDKEFVSSKEQNEVCFFSSTCVYIGEVVVWPDSVIDGTSNKIYGLKFSPKYWNRVRKKKLKNINAHKKWHVQKVCWSLLLPLSWLFASRRVRGI